MAACSGVYDVKHTGTPGDPGLPGGPRLPSSPWEETQQNALNVVCDTVNMDYKDSPSLQLGRDTPYLQVDLWVPTEIA